MTLLDYMKEGSLTLKAMEAKTGIDFRVIHRYVKGNALPSLKNAHKIYIGTKRKVKLKDWFVDEKY